MRVLLTFALVAAALTTDCQLAPDCVSSYEQDILGRWAPNIDSNVDFIVREDEFYDFEHLYSYSYRLCADTLIVLDSTFTVSEQIIMKLSDDSLALVNPDGLVSRFIRR